MVPQVHLFISFNVEEVGKQVAASTNVHILSNFAKEQNIKYFYDITDHRDFMANPEYKGLCHIANANLESIPIKSVVDKDCGISLDQRTHLHAKLNVCPLYPPRSKMRPTIAVFFLYHLHSIISESSRHPSKPLISSISSPAIGLRSSPATKDKMWDCDVVTH
nr:3-isopropylmalate dehydratase large subunit, chloroplastic-like [Tanacetum cinerariifolium]